MSDYIKIRDILFQSPHDDAQQAHSASLTLLDLDGVQHATAVNANFLILHYDVREITLYDIETLLYELGYHLDNSLFCKLKRALFYYTEETQRANYGLSRHTKQYDSVFVDQYERRSHGCRDQRPEHWREYK